MRHESAAGCVPFSTPCCFTKARLCTAHFAACNPPGDGAGDATGPVAGDAAGDALGEGVGEEMGPPAWQGH